MERQLPLEGIRVVDLTIWIQGPLASAILGDLGAEVIKIEKPGQGDFSRGARSMMGQTLVLANGRNMMWELANRNKKGIAVNLYHAKGREVLYRLVESADVMVTNLHPQALLQMGADRETILKHNPDIIYARSTGFGPRGPHAEDPCQDTVGMARSGFMFLDATPEGNPVYPPGGLSDVLSATMLAFGIVTSILAKERTGKTPTVYTSQLSTMMWGASYPVSLYANMGAEYAPFDRTDVANPLMNIYKCGDGLWFAAGIFVSDRYWHEFCMAMGIEDLEHDPRFATEDLRMEHRKELIPILDRVFASQPRAEWERRFRELGLWCSVVNRYRDLPSDPQVQANGYIAPLDSGVQAVPIPFQLEGLSLRRRGAPEHSQDTDDVLQEVCGYTWDEVVEMKAEEVVW